MHSYSPLGWVGKTEEAEGSGVGSVWVGDWLSWARLYWEKKGIAGSQIGTVEHISIQCHKEWGNADLLLIENHCLVTQLCPTLFYPIYFSPPGSSVHGDSPGKNTGVGCHAPLQGIFPTQRSNPGLHIAGGFFTSQATREAQNIIIIIGHNRIAYDGIFRW